MKKQIPDIYEALQQITWIFGDHGINGECCGDLSLVEFMGLKKACGSGEVSVHKIGAALNFTKSGATRITDRLENKGYVARRRSREDGRVCCLEVTPKGENAVAAATKRYTGYLEKKLAGLDRPKLDKISGALKMLSAALQDGK